jgi:hypothetical protein
MRIAVENSIDCIPVVGPMGGVLPGIYPCNAAGQLTYKPVNGDEYTGASLSIAPIPGIGLYQTHYYAFDEEGTRWPLSGTYEAFFTYNLGANENILNLGGVPGGPYSRKVTMYMFDDLAVSNSAAAWFYDINDIVTTATATGLDTPNVQDSQVANYQLTKEYVGPYLPELGWGDYSLSASITDPNGVVTQADNNGVITALWSPFAFITKVDGNTNMRDSLPPVTSSSVQVEYTYGGTFALDENGNPVYDENGAIANIGGLTQSESVTLVEGNNTIGPFTTPVDDAGKTSSTDSKTLSATIPTFTAWDDAEQFYGITGYDESSTWDDAEQFYGIIGEL